MSELVDHLAELTGFRDRDVLDTTLASALRDLLRPRSVTVYRCVRASDVAASQHWITRSRLTGGDVAATSDSAWIDLERLPTLDASPERAHCLREQVVVALPGPPALTMFPLGTDRGTVGVVEIETDAPLDAAAQRLVANILRIVRNVQALLDYGERDSLTGLLNRKTFEDNFIKAAQEQPRAAAGDITQDDERRARVAPLAHWLGIIDIDHFKHVNDNHGHLIGDEVLLLLARLMRSTFRHHDRLYRFGGEEFVVLVRCTGDAEAAMAFERLRTNVECYPFPQVGRVTVSAGFTAVAHGDAPSAAFARADKAVYAAKQQGRNRVVSYATLLASGLLPDPPKSGDIELF